MENSQEITVKVTVVTEPPLSFEVKSKVSELKMVDIALDINGAPLNVTISEKELVKGTTVQTLNPRLTMNLIKVARRDDLNNYVLNFMQWYFVVIQFQDAVREGDIKRTNILLKHMIPFFYSHSTLSKYMTECIDYILKTEHVLSPQLSLRVRAGSFVNPSGRLGKNKASDLQKENQIKFLKSLICSLGSNKTEKSIVDITKAAPLIMEISENFDDMICTKSFKNSHKAKSRDDDVIVILNKLKQLDIWTIHQHRTLNRR